MDKQKKTSTRLNKGVQKYGKVKAKYLKGEATLEKLRQAAIQEVTEKGYHRTSVCELVRRADLTRGAFYNYWSSLDECIIDLLHSIKESMENDPVFYDYSERMKRHHPSLTVQWIMTVLSMFIKKNWRAGYVLMALIQDKEIPGKMLQKKLKEYVDVLRDEWMERIRTDQKAKIFRPDLDPGTVAVGLLSQVGLFLHMSDLKYMDYRKEQESSIVFFLNSCLTDATRKTNSVKSVLLDRI